ncbi:MAG: GNAT family N-acetyltransferase [Chloroflexi bacterium]|nr:GNAT family N-acetyltransferase [Chloroflexota bacterium]
MQDYIKTYRHMVTLNDGAHVLLRALTQEDKNALIEFFAPISREELKFMRNDVTDRALVSEWVDNLDYTKVLPIIALLNNRIVGNTTIHFHGSGPQRHVAEVRVFLGKEVRKRGVGTALLHIAIEMARKMGLQQLVVEVVADQVSVIHAFENLGFEKRVVLTDYYMMPDGETHDVIVLILPLIRKKEQF